ncbi:hypothetical protein GWK48_10550 [Metallosphaera tengchongensis]|uniref:CRISPR type III-associated protein domain-containing protein n=2 Tax=Metallosphaera tengchongensis TaxID=1532350 RepID=A0A6N0P030_9CREN|nr:hypothetical protein GWK48_10550 [Metallosphaera tengchongensis]
MRRVLNYYFATSSYIPSTTLRGAILNEFYQQKKRVPVDFYASPAYPARGAPAHYFSPASGRKSEGFEEEQGILRRVEEEMKGVKDEKGLLNILSNRVKDMKPKVGTIVLYEKNENGKNKYKEFHSESIVNMHVAIDKRTGSSHHGMLFAYEYKKVMEMWALASPGEVLDVVKASKKILVGRGKMRSGNVVDVEVVRELSDFERPEGLVYCLSQCVPRLFGKEVLMVRRLGDRMLAIGDTSMYTGWFTTDTLRGTRPTFKVMREGTLLFVEEGKLDLRAAGLNFAFKIPDLGELIKRVM